MTEGMCAAEATLPPLVDRQEEVARIAEALDAAERGEGQMLLLRGEAGGGKTRLRGGGGGVSAGVWARRARSPAPRPIGGGGLATGWVWARSWRNAPRQNSSGC